MEPKNLLRVTKGFIWFSSPSTGDLPTNVTPGYSQAGFLTPGYCSQARFLTPGYCSQAGFLTSGYCSQARFLTSGYCSQAWFLSTGY